MLDLCFELGLDLDLDMDLDLDLDSKAYIIVHFSSDKVIKEISRQANRFQGFNTDACIPA